MRGPPAYHGPGQGAGRAGKVLGLPEAQARFPGLDADAWRAADARFPVRIPRAWADAVAGGDPLRDPLGRQAFPSPAELEPDGDDNPDPVGERGLSPLPWVVRKHEDRALLLLTRRCHLYCRYCFRRNHEGPQDPPAAELDAALAWLRGQGLREVILSGGDPLAVRDDKLFAVIDALRPAVPTIRVHTRAPITAPERVTDALAAGLSARRPVWVVVHCNHPAELTAAARAGLARLVDAGIPVLNQAVLLRGVNDDAAVLAALCEDLVALRVFPYYLHHTDPASGNASFRVDVPRGLALYRDLARRVSGLALPRYVIDPPDGSGKIPVDEWARKNGIL